jgi:demethylmenaquinone methyltransferase / 2-methoxy-6-polyprenyl-1,4-benzoquinol methylase
VNDKQPARIARMFDAIAGVYDFLNHLLSAGLDRRWRRRAIDSLGLTGRETVLDLCTGTADLGLAALSARQHASRVIGVDFSEGMLRRASRKVRRRGRARAFALVRGDAACIPVRSGSMDAAVVAFGLRNVERLPAALAEIHRTLASGGQVAILEFAIPDAGAIRAAYLWYFTRVLPAIGRVLSGHGSAYTYLPASVQAFPPPGAIATLLGHHGFSSVTAVRLTAGIVYLYMGTKDASPDPDRGRQPGPATGRCYNR